MVQQLPIKKSFNLTSRILFLVLLWISFVFRNSDVIPPPPPSATIETSQVVNTVKTELLPSPIVNVEPISPQIEQSKSKIKRHASSGSSSRYSHPVPQPLTLQGEKTVETDCAQAIRRTASCTMVGCQRRGSLKGQPTITELFEESHIEAENPVIKSGLTPSTNPSTVKLKKQGPSFVKGAKPKKTVVINKTKTSTTISGKTEMKCQSTNTEIKEENETDDNKIVIGGTDWMMTVKPQIMNDDESALSYLSQVPTVDDEDIPSCTSPTDQLASSQTTLMTSFGDIEVCIRLHLL